MNRKDEIRHLLQRSPQEIVESTGEHLIVLNTIDDLYQHMAEAIFDEIVQNKRNGVATTIILPVGPVG